MKVCCDEKKNNILNDFFKFNMVKIIWKIKIQ